MRKTYVAIAVVLALTSAECARLSAEGQRIYNPPVVIHTDPQVFQPTPPVTIRPLPKRPLCCTPVSTTEA